jgi:hypothetical protein
MMYFYRECGSPSTFLVAGDRNLLGLISSGTLSYGSIFIRFWTTLFASGITCFGQSHVLPVHVEESTTLPDVAFGYARVVCSVTIISSRDRWRTFVNAVMNLWVPKMRGIC